MDDSTPTVTPPAISDMSDRDLIALSQATRGEGAEADALAAEIERRNLDL